MDRTLHGSPFGKIEKAFQTSDETLEKQQEYNKHTHTLKVISSPVAQVQSTMPYPQHRSPSPLEAMARLLQTIAMPFRSRGPPNRISRILPIAISGGESCSLDQGLRLQLHCRRFSQALSTFDDLRYRDRAASPRKGVFLLV